METVMRELGYLGVRVERLTATGEAIVAILATMASYL